MSSLLGCVVVLAPVLFATTPNGYHDVAPGGLKQAYLRYEQISSVVEIEGNVFRNSPGYRDIKSKSPVISVIHTLDGTRYAVDMDAKAVFALPCSGVPAAVR